MLLADLPVICLDCQTTDTVPARGALLEIGWLVSSVNLFRAAPLSASSSLVALPEHEELPRDVARLTGIEELDLVGAPSFADLWAKISAIEAGACIIHYCRFERSFLDAAGATYPWEILCTHVLSRRLYPGLPAWGLRAVSGHLGHPLPLLQRAAPQAEATMHIWSAIVDKLATDGVTTLDELREWEARPVEKTPRRRTYMVEREKRLALPSAPGVYRMTARDGKILYVGKATNLKSRVSSYFREKTKRALRLSEMLAQVVDVQVEPTESALEAALLETDEIKKFDPRYNTSLRVTGRGIRFCSRDFREITGRPDAAHPLGPFSTFGPLEVLSYLQDLFDDEDLELDPIFTGLESRALFDAGVKKALGDIPRDTDSLLRHGFQLLRRLGERVEETEVDADEEEWTVALVVERIEKTIYRAARHVLRGHWISRLGDSTLVWRQGEARRMIVFDRGVPISRAYLDDSAEIPPPPGWRRSLLERKASLDIAGYDRLRTVLTEMRALVDGRKEVELRLSPRLRLTEKTLKRWLF